MSPSIQRNLPAMEVPKADSPVRRRESDSPEKGLPAGLPEKTLHQAKAEIGACLRQTINATGANTKEFGDTSQVARVCDGNIPEPLARAWQTAERRRAFVMALAKASGCFVTEITLRTHDEQRTA
jgi:hypothetical protein